jgi:hypothetical protein
MLRIYCLSRNSTSLWFALFNLGHKRYIQCTNRNVLELLECQEYLSSCVYISVCMYFQRNAQETYSFVISLNFIYPFWFFREMSINHCIWYKFVHIFLFLALYLENLTHSMHNIMHDTGVSEIETSYGIKLQLCFHLSETQPTPKSTLSAGYIIWLVNVFKISNDTWIAASHDIMMSINIDV